MTNYTGVASVPGAQIFVWRYPQGTVSILYPTDFLGLLTPVLDNPLTTDLGDGSYSFWTLGPVKIVEIAPSKAAVSQKYIVYDQPRARKLRSKLNHVVFNSSNE